MQPFVLFEWKVVGTKATLLANDSVAECRPLSQRGEGKKILNPASHNWEGRLQNTHSTSLQLTNCNCWRKRIPTQVQFSSEDVALWSTCDDPTSIPRESLCPWQQEPEKSAVQGAFSYFSFPSLLPLIGCQPHLTVASWPPPPGWQVFSSSQRPDEQRVLPAPSIQPWRETVRLHSVWLDSRYVSHMPGLSPSWLIFHLWQFLLYVC